MTEPINMPQWVGRFVIEQTITDQELRDMVARLVAYDDMRTHAERVKRSWDKERQETTDMMRGG